MSITGKLPEGGVDSALNDEPGGLEGVVQSLPNGFTRLIRRIMSVICMITFFTLVTLDFVFGWVAKEVPIWLYALMFSGAAAGWGPLFNILNTITTRKGV